MSPNSPEDSPRSADGSDPGSFQIADSALGPGACGFCGRPLRVESLFPTAFWLFPKQAPLAFKPNILRVNLSGAGPPGLGTQYGAQTPGSLDRTSAIVIFLPFVCRPRWGVGFHYVKSLPLIPTSLWLLFIFSCRRSFLLVLWSFSSIHAL